jgi:hypothetical protein
MTDTTWVPGDPLYPAHSNPNGSSGGRQYRMGLFNFRDDPDREYCNCADAASWPEPTSRSLPLGDELADFIAAWHRWRETEETPA